MLPAAWFCQLPSTFPLLRNLAAEWSSGRPFRCRHASHAPCALRRPRGLVVSRYPALLASVRRPVCVGQSEGTLSDRWQLVSNGGSGGRNVRRLVDVTPVIRYWYYGRHSTTLPHRAKCTRPQRVRRAKRSESWSKKYRLRR